MSEATVAHGAPASAARGLRWWARRAVVGAVVGLQLAAVVAAYFTPHKVFGWQMFPESTQFRAEIVRIEGDGTRHGLEEPWPGGYRWADMVTGRGLGVPGTTLHAAYGADATLDLLESALGWVAANTPADTRTAWLEARTTVWVNGRPPHVFVLTSPRRPEVGP